MMKNFFLICLCILNVCSEELDELVEESFLAQNAENPDIVVTDSGLQYEILIPADGERAKVDQIVDVHYEGKLLDGTVFDSSAEKGPISFSPKQVIPGWKEGLQLMPKGSKFRFYIPAKLGYGSRAQGKIPANSMLIFEVELVDIKEPAPETWFQKVFLQPIVGPIKLLHVIMFALYVGMKYWIRQPGSGGGNKVRCNASHILIKHEIEDAENKIKAIQTRLGDNCSVEDFAKEAKEHSGCPSGASSGGSLNWFNTGDMVPEFDKVCFDKSNNLNTVLGPVKTQFGWHLLYIVGREFPEPPAESKKTK